MKVQCQKCGHIREYVLGIGKSMICGYKGCYRTITKRHEVKKVKTNDSKT